MRTVGVICEYNPFHRGHLTQFRQIRTLFGEDAAIICLMSGNFVQRGECAVFDKLVRASAAVDCGASLVLELPVTGALRSAEGFARCGVEILDALGVEMLAFGSESGETENYLCLAAAMDTPEYNAELRAALASGQSYPAAREAAAKSLHLPGELLKTPNNILGLEYCKAALGRRIRPPRCTARATITRLPPTRRPRRPRRCGQFWKETATSPPSCRNPPRGGMRTRSGISPNTASGRCSRGCAA